MTIVNVPLPLDLEPLAVAGALPLEVAEESALMIVSVGLCGRCLVDDCQNCRQNAHAPASGPFEAWRCVCACQGSNGRQNGAQR